MNPPAPAPDAPVGPPDGFGPENLPYGVDGEGRVVVAYGDSVIDLAVLARDGGSPGDRGPVPSPEVFSSGSLNAFMALGRPAWDATRQWLRRRLHDLPTAALRPRPEAALVLPFVVSDYVDFYSCEAHALAMGRLLRPGERALPPAWRYLPIGYHGRSSTVTVGGGQVNRPSGLVAGPSGPEVTLTRRLDFEVELGFVVGTGNGPGCPVPVAAAADHVFGVVLVNDWSARDIQAFEYKPLGPFLGKSFATSVSPWVVPLAALEPWRVAGPAHKPKPPPYLRQTEPRLYAVNLGVALNGTVLATMSTAGLYWSMAQQYAHLTVNGASTRTGELFATGTVSSSEPGNAGSLMELTNDGRDPVVLANGAQRRWLEDGDEVVVRGWCGAPGEPGWISLGEVRGQVAGPSGRTARAGARR